MDAPVGLRERKKQETRRAIQAAAINLFEAHGFEAVTMSDIAQAADVSLRTVAVHYPTKHDLVLAELADDIKSLTMFIEQREPGVSTFDAMHAWIKQLLAAKHNTSPAHIAESTIRQQCKGVIHQSDHLVARFRGELSRILPTLISSIAVDLGVEETELAPLIAASAALGILTMLVEHSDDEPEPSDAEASTALEQVFAFLHAGVGSLPSNAR